MKRVLLSAVLPFLASGALMSAADPTEASEKDKRFFQSVEGSWIGPGEIVAGKYKGTKFTCTFAGSTPTGKVGMALDGTCRVGMFTQRMSASIEKRGNSYRGTFLDGAAGKGLDVIAGNVTGNKVVMSLNRSQLKGAMIARVSGENQMVVTVSVKVEKEMVPVIGINLKRVDGGAVGSVARN
ncbi:MAG: hypothetical protein AB7I79_09175 [Rhizobiaceae bacterium]